MGQCYFTTNLYNTLRDLYELSIGYCLEAHIPQYHIAYGDMWI